MRRSIAAPAVELAQAGPPATSPDVATPQRPPATVASMRLGQPVQAPEGFLAFCTRHPVDCARTDDADGAQAARLARRELAGQWMRLVSVDGAGGPGEPMVSDAPEPAPEIAPAAPESLTLVDAVSRDINHRIRPMTDRQRYGVDAYWATPLEDGSGPAYGDCKDYAVEKRRALVSAGISADDLSLAVVLTRGGDAHLVLVVSTEAGDYVADSLSNRILPWRDVPYRWVARQEPGQPMVWRAVLG